MKIGFSFGRCVRDIVMGRVALEDVLVIIARTRIEKREQIEPVVRQYLYEPDYLNGLSEEDCMTVAHTLWDSARLHQPRIYSQHPGRIPEAYVWMDVVPTALSDNPVVQSAWDHYVMSLRLDDRQPPPAR